jgi:hypothetical protein
MGGAAPAREVPGGGAAGLRDGTGPAGTCGVLVRGMLSAAAGTGREIAAGPAGGKGGQVAAEGGGPVPRRGVLAAALAAPLLVTGCSKGFGALATPPAPAPDVGVLTSAIAGERHLIAAYQAVLAALPALSGTLAPLLAEHRSHVQHLTARLVPGAITPAPSQAASQRPPRVPADAGSATAYLAAAEKAAATALLARIGVASPSLAQLLASIAASEDTHAAALGARVGPG